MPHPLVEQLRFARSEFWRGLDGIRDEDAVRRVGPANPISWSVGHLAWQEQRYWLIRMQGLEPLSQRLVDEFCFGCDSASPPLAEIRAIWDEVIAACDHFLETLTTDSLFRERDFDGVFAQPGSLMHRAIYHYWFHLGENMGLRQALGHTDLPQFVGNIDDEAPFKPWT